MRSNPVSGVALIGAAVMVLTLSAAPLALADTYPSAVSRLSEVGVGGIAAQLTAVLAAGIAAQPWAKRALSSDLSGADVLRKIRSSTC